MREVMGSSPFTSTKSEEKHGFSSLFILRLERPGEVEMDSPTPVSTGTSRMGFFRVALFFWLPVDFFGEMEATILFIVLKIVFLAFPLTDSEADEFW